MTSDAHEDMHASELETSILLAAFPDYLRPGWERDDHTCGDRRLLNVLGMAAHTSSGMIGLPSLATEAKGHAALRRLADGAHTVLKAINDASHPATGRAGRSAPLPAPQPGRLQVG